MMRGGECRKAIGGGARGVEFSGGSVKAEGVTDQEEEEAIASDDRGAQAGLLTDHRRVEGARVVLSEYGGEVG